MKKILPILVIFVVLISGFFLFSHLANRGIPKIPVQEETIKIDKLFIYGNHLNMHGNFDNIYDYDLVLYDGKFTQYQIIIDDDNNEFILGDKINEGIMLENIPRGTYYLFLRSKQTNDNGKDSYKYYIIDNQTEYKETEYYTFSTVNNRIVINSDNEYNTLMIKVSENKNNEVYDVVIDPGHGGMDSGATKNGLKEAVYTLNIALNLKKKLEDMGVKVKLTREEGQLNGNETLPNYGENGRVAVPFKAHAKYLFSIHLNSSNYSSVGGLEVYTPARINYDFAKVLVNNIVAKVGANYSKNTIDQVYDGIYTRTWTKSEIEEANKEYIEKDMIPYDITTNTNYYFIIRETGGIMTGAYVDNRNEKIGSNAYYKSNVGIETYLLELGYITNKNDVDNIDNNMNGYTEAIAESFKTLFIQDKNANQK